MKAREVAVRVLRVAAGMDYRMLNRDLSQMADAWALAFDGKVWPDEGVAAVVAHYSKPNSFPIMPGDVVDYCARQPVWSSEDHVRDWLCTLEYYPNNVLIHHYSGYRQPADPAKYGPWFVDSFDPIVEAILARKTPPPVA